MPFQGRINESSAKSATGITTRGKLGRVSLARGPIGNITVEPDTVENGNGLHGNNHFSHCTDTYLGAVNHHERERMKRTIIIEPWKAAADYVHCHEEGCDGIHKFEASVVNCTTVDRVIHLGMLSGFITKRDDGDYRSDKSMEDFCEMADAVLHYSDKEIADAREQIEGSLDCGERFLEDSITVAYLDWMFRENLADEARSVVNPFAEKIMAYGLATTTAEKGLHSTCGNSKRTASSLFRGFNSRTFGCAITGTRLLNKTNRSLAA